MCFIRARLALVWLLAFATSAAAETPPAAQGDARLGENSASQPLDVPQEGSTAKRYSINVKIVQGRRLLERQELPRGTVIAELVARPSVAETASDRCSPSTATPNSSDSATGSIAVKLEVKGDVWDTFVDSPETRVLTSPTITTPQDLVVHFQMRNKTAFSYLVPTRDGTLRLEKTPPQELGLRLAFTVKSIEGDSQSVELSPIEASQTSLDGREIIEGVDLNVGKPIFSTRSLKTAAKFTLGRTRVITIYVDDERQVLLLLNVKRAAN